jgi:hypothetical protein
MILIGNFIDALSTIGRLIRITVIGFGASLPKVFHCEKIASLHEKSR